MQSERIVGTTASLTSCVTIYTTKLMKTAEGIILSTHILISSVNLILMNAGKTRTRRLVHNNAEIARKAVSFMIDPKK